MDKKELEKILKFLHFANGLKYELRHSWGADGRRESVAEHCWRISLMAMLLAPHLKNEVDLEKTLKMLIVHDIIEAEVGDIPTQNYQYSKAATKDKSTKEHKAIENVKKILTSKTGDEIYDLWKEFEENETYEARFATAMDKIEVRLQHVEDPIETWSEFEIPRGLFAADRYCKFDDTIKRFNELVKHEAEVKLRDAGHDIRELKKQAEELRKKVV